MPVALLLSVVSVTRHLAAAAVTFDSSIRSGNFAVFLLHSLSLAVGHTTTVQYEAAEMFFVFAFYAIRMYQ